MPCLEDLRLMAYLHGGFPLVDEPYAAVAQALGTTEQDVLQRLQRLLDDGYLTRFGPLFQIERAGVYACRPAPPWRCRKAGIGSRPPVAVARRGSMDQRSDRPRGSGPQDRRDTGAPRPGSAQGQGTPSPGPPLKATENVGLGVLTGRDLGHGPAVRQRVGGLALALFRGAEILESLIPAQV